MNENGFLNLSQFTKIDKIGQGSFGKVFKVKQNDTNKIYAAKISTIPLTEEEESLNLNLRREVNIIAQLNHPSVLKFIGYSPINFNQNPKPVIITEYASNGSLSSIIKLERQGLSPPQWDDTKKLINIFGIASAMSYLHSHNIIHRDLKPENILEDDYLFPKICDFGLSKIYHSNKESMSTESQAGYKGTPIYIPPETWSREEYSTAGDVYAFALIVYELMTLDEPFKKFTISKIFSKIVTEKYRPEFKSPIDDCYKDLINRCWSNDPKQRPTFDEIVFELKNNSDFITNTVDANEFYNYVEYTENYHSSFDPSKKFKKITLGSEKIIETEEEKTSEKVELKQTSEKVKLKQTSEKVRLNKILETNDFNSIITNNIPFKILVMGHSYTNKEDIIHLMVPARYRETFKTTIGVDFVTKYFDIEGNKIKLQIWTTKGQEKFKLITKAFYRGAYGLVFVFNTAIRETFLLVKDWMENLAIDDRLPLDAVLIGDKDKQYALINSEEIEELTNKYNIRYFEVSSDKNYENVEEAFYSLSVDIYNSLKMQSNQEGASESESQQQQQQQQQSLFSKIKNIFTKH